MSRFSMFISPVWNNGMLEYWNKGNQGAPSHPLFHHSTIPVFHFAQAQRYL
jgi:hypothetical protein